MTEKSTTPTIATVNDGYLIITLTKSIAPVVWRLELEKAKVAAFEILKTDKKHTLTIKVASKSVETIGAYKDADNALEALLAISEALQNIPKQSIAAPYTAPTPIDTPIAAAEGQSNQTSQNKNNRTAIALLATCLVLGLFYYYWGRTIPTTQTFETQSISSETNPAKQTGVAISADELLKGF